MACLLASGGCFPPPESGVSSTVTGDPIVLEEIVPILNDTSLTQDQKRQELQDLGVPDDLIEVLLRA